MENDESNFVKTVMCSMELLKTEAKELYLPGQIDVLRDIPEPLEFYRTWVSPNIPVLIKSAAMSWPAVKKWNKNYLIKTLNNKKVTVATTPNGYADAITRNPVDGKDCFVLPDERFMTISDFLSKLDGTAMFSDPEIENSNAIFYIQKQNSNLTEDFPELLPDIDRNLLWASSAFNSKPTAINLWIGDSRAVTSLHKDPFENIYVVISGHKDFILFPPTDRPWLPYKNFPMGQYKERNREFKIELFDKKEDFPESHFVPWIDIDPCDPDLERYPMFKNASPLHVRVEKGDMLYLPALWFHHVRQSHQCMAVNFWYDMNFDIKYAYFQFLESLAKACGT